MTALRTALTLTLVVLLAGCEMFVEADPADAAPVIAVYGLFEAGRPWRIDLFRTAPINLDDPDGFVSIGDATVMITSGDGTVVTLPPTSIPGGYGPEYIVDENGQQPSDDDPQTEAGPAPEAGRTYTLRVEAPGLPVVTATNRTPEAPIGTGIRLVRGWVQTTRTFSGETLVSYTNPVLAVTLAPRSAQERLEVSFVTARLISDGDGVERDCIVRDLSFATAAPILSESTFLNDVQGGVGQSFSSAFLDVAALGAGPVEIEIEGDGDRAGGCLVGADVRSVSEDYFRYIQSGRRRQAAEGNPFAEPVPTFSNVDGGVGIFAGATRVRHRIRR